MSRDALHLRRIGSFLFFIDFEVGTVFLQVVARWERDFSPKSGSLHREIGTGVPRRCTYYYYLPIERTKAALGGYIYVYYMRIYMRVAIVIVIYVVLL